MSPSGKGDSSSSSSKANTNSSINDLELIDKPLQVDKWDGCAVKNALDDTVKKIMIDTYGYAESHALMDGRLVICTVACLFALFAMVWDYFHPFPESRSVLIICVLAYFAMMVVLTFYTTYCEQGIFLEAVDIDPTGVDPTNKWILSSARIPFVDWKPSKSSRILRVLANLLTSVTSVDLLPSRMSRFDDVYTLELVFVDGKTGATRSADVARSVAGYVDENGLVCEDIFTAEVNRLHSELLLPAKKDQ